MGSKKEWNLLSFAVRCLEFMVPSPKVTRDVITKTYINRYLAWGLKKMKHREQHRERFMSSRERGPEEILCDLLNAAHENRTIIADSIEKLIIERVNSGSEHEALLSLEIGLHLSSALYRIPLARELEREVIKFWDDVSNRIYTACSDQINNLSSKHFSLCHEAVRRGKSSITNLIKSYGIEGLFRAHSYIMLPHLYMLSLTDLFIWVLLKDISLIESGIPFKDYIHNLREISQILLSTPTPWIKKYQGSSLISHYLIDRDFLIDKLKKPVKLDNETLFSAFAIFAVMLEDSAKKEEKKDKGQIFLKDGIKRLIEGIKKSQYCFFDFLQWIFIARFMPVELDKVQAEMDKSAFTAEQQAFVWRWVRQEIELIQ
jgi:hypothetical protein